MAILATGISLEGVQVLITNRASDTLYALSMIDVPFGSVRYLGFLYATRPNPSLGRAVQIPGGVPIWLKDTGIRTPVSTTSNVSLIVAWRFSGFQWELADFAA